MRTARVLGWFWIAPPVLMALPAAWAPRTRPEPKAIEAFERYSQVTEEELKSLAAAKTFLSVDPNKQARMRAGEIVVTERERADHGRKIEAPKALIQDWEGAMFVPGATLDRFRSLLQNYDSYKKYYSPAVMESRLKARQNDEFAVFLRLFKPTIFTVVLNVDYSIQYSFPLPNRMMIVSRSTRIAEVKNPDHPNGAEYPVENDTGFLWRLNTYWRVEEADGGAYAQCEAISLSRDAPMGLGAVLRGFLAHFPKDSMTDTMWQTRAAVVAGH